MQLIYIYETNLIKLLQYLGSDLDLILLGRVAELGLTLSDFLIVPHSASVEYIFWSVWRA